MTTRKTKASTGDEADDYAVGYGKPPKDTQFRPGQSGNAAVAARECAISRPT